MATFVQKKQNTADASGTTLTVTLDGATTAGTLLLCFLKWEAGNDFEGVGDSVASVVEGSGAFTAGTGQDYQGVVDLNAQWHYKLVAEGGDSTIVVTWTIAREFKFAQVYEFSYTGTATLDTQIATARATSSSVATGNITTDSTAGVVACGAALYGSRTVTAGTADINGVDADQNLTIASSQAAQSWVRNTGTLNFTGQGTGTLSSSIEWLANMLSIKMTGGASGGGPLVNGGSITHGSLIRGGRILG